MYCALLTLPTMNNTLVTVSMNQTRGDFWHF